MQAADLFERDVIPAGARSGAGARLHSHAITSSHGKATCINSSCSSAWHAAG